MLAATRAAGHAVARWWLGSCSCVGRKNELPLRLVAIGGRNSVQYGICDADPCIDPAKPPPVAWWKCRLARADVVQFMAGPIAERHEEGDPLGDYKCWLVDATARGAFCLGAGGNEHSEVQARIPLLSGRSTKERLSRPFSIADHIVRHHQSHIRTLAKALEQHRAIKGQDVFRLFDCTGQPIRLPCN